MRAFWVWLIIIVLSALLWAGLVYLFLWITAHYYLRPLLELLAIFAAALRE